MVCIAFDSINSSTFGNLVKCPPLRATDRCWAENLEVHQGIVVNFTDRVTFPNFIKTNFKAHLVFGINQSIRAQLWDYSQSLFITALAVKLIR